MPLIEQACTSRPSDLVQTPLCSYGDSTISCCLVGPSISSDHDDVVRKDTLTDLVKADLRRVLMGWGMTTTPRQFAALDDVIMTLGAMADGVCPPHVHLSSLDPGTGKTTALIQFLKRVVVSEDHGMVGVLVCLSWTCRGLVPLF